MVASMWLKTKWGSVHVSSDVSVGGSAVEMQLILIAQHCTSSGLTHMQRNVCDFWNKIDEFASSLLIKFRIAFIQLLFRIEEENYLGRRNTFLGSRRRFQSVGFHFREHKNVYVPRWVGDFPLKWCYIWVWKSWVSWVNWVSSAILQKSSQAHQLLF
jgi:hypothetical protein